jgi:hypothetical protein
MHQSSSQLVHAVTIYPSISALSSTNFTTNITNVEFPLAGTGGWALQTGEATRFNFPDCITLAANNKIVVVDTNNHWILVVTSVT